MAFEPTKAQKAAIESSGGALVCAAAGSGKTAVLVERVVKKICDKNSPVDADRLLVVTFTEAAAAEMRTRIEERLTEEVAEQPENKRLLRQQILLPGAHIGTIDSFCVGLVRQNFNYLGVQPNFKVADLDSMRADVNRVLDGILRDEYASHDDGFDDMMSTLGASYGEAGVFDSIINLYIYTRSLPFPNEWLDSAAALYDSGGISRWAEVVMARGRVYINAVLSAIADAKGELGENSGPEAVSALDELARLWKHAALSAQNGDWDGIYTALNDALRYDTPTGAGPAKSLFRKLDRVIRDKQKLLAGLFSQSYEQTRRTVTEASGYAKKLVDIVKRLSDAVAAEQIRKNTLSFDYIEHLALSLLCKLQNGEIVATEKAREISGQFAEVLVDEYQDVNDLQNALFTALSDGGRKLFLVGDVKQSIYAFRHANPDIFLAKREACDNGGGAKIVLANNFRSRKGICDYVNRIFSLIMTKDTCGMDYTGEDMLVPSAKYPERNESDVELHLVDSLEAEDGSVRAEARYIAGYINELLKTGTVTDKESGLPRRVQAGDIVVLMRSISQKAAIYCEEFERCGVPVSIETSGFFDTAEIMMAMSLMHAVDNPSRDVPLLAAMMSPVFGFTPESVASIRAEYPENTVIASVRRAAAGGDESCGLFLKRLGQMKALSSTMSPGRFLSALYDMTGLPYIICAMENGNKRRANLMQLLAMANDFSDAFGTLASFLRAMDNLKDKGGVTSAAHVDDGRIRIMTVHKSKGLQFPVCILASYASQMNRSDTAASLLYDEKLYFGSHYVPAGGNTRFNTVARNAINIAVKRRNVGEEMRVLYVAMTRAEEKLVIVICKSNLHSKFQNLSENSGPPDAETVLSASSVSNWILQTAALCRPNATSGAAGEAVKLVFASASERVVTGKREQEAALPSEELTDILRERFEAGYTYPALSGIPAKSNVTDLLQKNRTEKNPFTSRPAFLSKHGLTPAERGTATHKFVQFMDIEQSPDNLEAERDRLVEWEYLTEEEAAAIELESVRRFMNSDIMRRIKNSQCYRREREFMVEICLAENPAEKTVLQGIADCVFEENGELVILDFKTDRVKNTEELVAMYKPQLDIYALALAEIEGKPVKECVLYSFYKNEAVSMTPDSELKFLKKNI